MQNLTNGMVVLGRREGVMFIRLPDALQVPIDRCGCPFCKAHPDKTPMWDTLAVHVDADPRSTRSQDYTWTVHMPDPTDARA